jgi:hypothetical protein
VALVYDGNDLGALRLSVDHHAFSGEPRERANAAALFWVRVGGGLESEAAFRRWRAAFGTDRVEVEADAGRVRARARGCDGSLSLAATSPYAGGGVMDPLPPHAVLQINGNDVGRSILRRLELVRRLPKTTRSAPLVRLSPGKSLVWEAEGGRVEPDMVVERDAQAGGGACVWLPGEAGAKVGGVGSVAWRLRVPRSAAYYLWGRVKTPTPEDDSFLVRVLGSSPLPTEAVAWHTGVHPVWEWTRLQKEGTREPLPLTLPAGEVTLQIGAREDGARLDRLFLTPNPEELPPAP